MKPRAIVVFVIVGLSGCGEGSDQSEVAGIPFSDDQSGSSDNLPKILGSAALTWLPPTRNTDGSALTDLAGYKVYWGRGTDSFEHVSIIDNAGITAYVVEGLNPGTWRFAVTAFDAKGIESAFSNTATKIIAD